MKSHVTLACYDISSSKRRTKVARLLSGFGVRVQKSVFELHVSRIELIQLRKKVEAMLNPDTDSARYYFLCHDCRELSAAVGQTNCVKVESHFVV